MVVMRSSPVLLPELPARLEPVRARLHLHRRPTCWPPPAQEPLIHAAAGDALEAISAWEHYEREIGPDEVLLPQIFRNLTRHGYSGAAALKPHYDSALKKNQARFQQMAPVIRALHMDGIPTLLLNGTALSLATYRDRGARPVRDFHILVPTSEADRALEHFAEKRWLSLEGFRMGLTAAQLRYRHAMHLTSPNGQSLHLHWHLLAQSRGDQADAAFWKSAWPAYLGEDRSLVLAPTHQLLHTCSQSLNGDPQWAVDALIIIRQCKVNWEELLKLANLHDVALPVADALAYLQHTFHAAIPRSLVWRLESEPIGRFALMEYRRLAQPQQDHGALVNTVHAYRSYLRGVRDVPTVERLTGFPHYLADRLRLPSALSLPRHFLHTAMRRLRGR